MQKEIERNDAISKLDISNERSNEAEAKLDDMETMIEEANGLFLNNEKIHRAFHVEMEERKNLHNMLEDLKGKIRVYVRIRPKYTERVIPLLTQEQKHKHLKFAKHYLNNWGLGAGKFILFHYDEKWFWGLLLRKTAKTFEEFEEKMKKRAMHTKRYGHIIKTISPKRWELRLLVLHSLTLWRMAETELSYILLVRRQLFFIRKERRIAC